MPIHIPALSIPALSRRSFLLRSSAAVASLAVMRQGWASEANDPNCFALFSDTHIPSSPDVSARGVNMTANLKQVIGEVLALDRKPAGVIINGDCAYLKGLPADYANLAECLAPLAPGGLPLHLSLGNHDDHAPLYDAFASQRPIDPPVQSKLVSVIETPYANLFLLDSQKAVNLVTGEIGEAQRKWLSAALDARADKPAIIIAHHCLQFEPPKGGGVWGGIIDTTEFWDLLKSKKQVKAFVYGHTHRWDISQQDGIHTVNLPPVAYLFAEGLPNGWVLAQLSPAGMALQMRTIDPAHPLNQKRFELTW